jgi:hypothetical protein
MRKVAELATVRTQILDLDGAAIETLPAFARNPEELVALYRAMVQRVP